MDRFRMLPNYQYYDDDTGILETQYKKEIRDYQIFGNSFQDGTPSPDNPIEIQSVGEKTENLFDINSIKKMVSSGGGNWNSYMKNENGILTNNMADYGGYSGYVVSMQLEKGLYCLSLDARYVETPGAFSITYNFNATVKQRFSTSLEWKRIFYIFELTEDTEITTWNFVPNGGKDNYLKRQAQFTNIMLSKIDNADEHPEYEPYGKYKIPIEVSNENAGTQTYNIFLDEPLRKCGDYSDYIDFKNGKVFRNIFLGHITTASFIHSKVAPSQGNHCCMTMNKEISNNKGILTNTPMLATSFPNASNRWSSKIESIFSHSSLSGYLYLKVNWDRLGLVYDGTNVYVNGDENQTALTDKEIVTYFTTYLNTLSKKEKEFIYVGEQQQPLETNIELPKLLLNKGTNIIKVKTAIEPYEVNWQYYK